MIIDKETSKDLQPGLYMFSFNKKELVITQLSSNYPENIKLGKDDNDDQKIPTCFEGNEIDTMSV